MYKLYTVTSLLLAMATTVTCSPIAGTDLSGDVTLLDKRQGSSGCPMITVVSTTDHSPGNGDPHQNYYHRQISNTVTCGSGDCSVTSESAPVSRFTNSATFEYWISGGFAVEQSLPGGDTFTCSASAGDTVCVWQNVAYTAYTVGAQCDDSVQGVSILTSPNTNNVGGGFYCVQGSACRSINQGYWEGGCVGGPQNYCGNGKPVA